jgi:threonine dehydratase
MVTFDDIRGAHDRIKGVINRTPVMTSRTLDGIVGARVFLKCENFQRVGAFKIRGALNAVGSLSDGEKKRGVITHSSGNHAQALALAARLSSVKAVVVMPKGASSVKVEATRGYGAEVIFCENSLDSRIETADDLISRFGYTLVHPYDNDAVIAGAGTAALELWEQMGGMDILVSPVGGGGLVSGSAVVVKSMDRHTAVVAVEPERADDAYRSLAAGRVVGNTSPDTIADGLRTTLCERTFAMIRQHVDSIVTVSEREIVGAMRFLWERMKLVVEPTGAVSLAGVLSDKIPVRGKRVGVIISGGNVDLVDYFQILNARISQERMNG